jgi:SAM-dependent methyltransferase
MHHPVSEGDLKAPFTCDVCRSTSGETFLAEAKDLYSGFPGSFDYVRCTSCGLVQLHPVPDNLGAFYENYDVHQKKGAAHEIMRSLLMTQAYFPCDASLKGKRLLDFGCGDGFFLKRARAAGAICFGFEINPAHASALSASLDLPVFSSWEEMEKAGPFEVITLHFVLEHMSGTPALIRKLGAMLSAGGEIYAVVPSIRSWEFKVFGKYWHGLDAPRHLLFLDREHIESICTEAHLELKSPQEVWIPTSLAGTLASLFGDRFSRKLFILAIPVSLLFFFVRPKGNWSFRLQKPAG